MKLSNYHTHTTYCDGKDSPRELVEKAIGLGMSAIGFSGHSYMETGDDDIFWMSPEGTEKYKTEVRALKEEYKNRLDILLGLERDYFSKDMTDDYDYTIGSVHYVVKNGRYLPVDASRELQTSAVNAEYGGDFYAFAEDYYSLVGDIYNKTGCDIVGHFDLITKFNKNNDLFDIRNPRYIKASENALCRLMNKGLYFEVNYGAVARGYKTAPYPEKRLLELLVRNGEKLIYSSDCHDKELLLFGIGSENDFVPRGKR